MEFSARMLHSCLRMRGSRPALKSIALACSWPCDLSTILTPRRQKFHALQLVLIGWQPIEVRSPLWIRNVRSTPESRYVRHRNRCRLSAKSGHLSVRLLAINGERKLAVCSLLEGPWLTRAVDASWPRF